MNLADDNIKIMDSENQNEIENKVLINNWKNQNQKKQKESRIKTYNNINM